MTITFQVGQAFAQVIDNNTLLTWQWFDADGARRTEGRWVYSTVATTVAKVEKKRRPNFGAVNRKLAAGGSPRRARWATEDWRVIA